MTENLITKLFRLGDIAKIRKENDILAERVKKNERLIINHMGSSGDEDIHEAVSRTGAGFAESRHIEYMPLPPDADVLTLPSGYYYGSTMKNIPQEPTNNSVKNLHVINSGSGMKTIILTVNSTGEKWERTIHFGGVGGSGWVRKTYLEFTHNQNYDSFKNTGVSGNLRISVDNSDKKGYDVEIVLFLNNLHQIQADTLTEIVSFSDFEGGNIWYPRVNQNGRAYNYNDVSFNAQPLIWVMTNSGISIVRHVDTGVGGSFRWVIRYRVFT